MIGNIDILKTLFNLSVFTCAILAFTNGGILGAIASFYVIVYGYVLLGKNKNEN